MSAFEQQPVSRELPDRLRYGEAFRTFLKCNPDYRETVELDRWRSREFARLDRQGHVYLDYTGGGLYGQSQLRRHFDFLSEKVLGNPHSSNPTSAQTTQWVESARSRVGRFFNADPDEYVVIFTANASHALKLVGESYPFRPGDRFLLTFDNHNSVNGIREFDRAHGAETTYVAVLPPEMRADEQMLLKELDALADRPGANGLFAYPAQSNFSGVQHPLEWVEQAQSRGWDVLLDAAAFIPTNRLDLSRFHPDFVALSFYKMFGYPTGVGALIARRKALLKLHRPWFAGGTIEVASVQADRFAPAAGAAAFEDGTLDYANLPAVEIGLDFIDTIGLPAIHQRVSCLTAWLLQQLSSLRHAEGSPAAVVYGPTEMIRRGGTVAFNFLDRRGRIIDHKIVEEQASQSRISLRTGCFCNPGAGEMALGLSRGEIESCFSDSSSGMTYEGFRGCISSKGSGAVRVSLGLASNFRDVHAFLKFASAVRTGASEASGAYFPQDS
ncbi:MAG TPA: aminotransferase class V-fold PLP-dependent enzyme [Acidobacteriota bacterium]|nr:aminotransferase class V-fold PLP-dependent enzyme [Acidobacteriota bacterium]